VFEFVKEGVVIFNDIIASHDNLNDNCRGKLDDDSHGSIR
jgi:hypothetical protein